MQAHSWLRVSRCLPALAAGLALLVPACASSDGGDEPSGSDTASLQITPRPPRPPLPPDSGFPPAPCDDGGADAGYFFCDQDDDCVAVPRFDNCCYNGWKIAVSSSEATQFLAATECPIEPGHLCPLYFVIDRRVPVCNVAERTCAMVMPDAGSPVVSPAPITPE